MKVSPQCQVCPPLLYPINETVEHPVELPVELPQHACHVELGLRHKMRTGTCAQGNVLFAKDTLCALSVVVSRVPV